MKIRYFSISGKAEIGKSTRRALNGEILADEFSGKGPREQFSNFQQEIGGVQLPISAAEIDGTASYTVVDDIDLILSKDTV